MFNSSLDAYGAVKVPTTVQSNNIAASKSYVAGQAGAKVPDSAANRPPVIVDRPALEAAVKKLNELVAPALQTVQFSMDDEADRMVVKVVDTVTQKVLRQIPNEEVLAFSKTLGRLQGLVVRERA